MWYEVWATCRVYRRKDQAGNLRDFFGNSDNFLIVYIKITGGWTGIDSREKVNDLNSTGRTGNRVSNIY